MAERRERFIVEARHRGGETTFHGPFETRALALAWAQELEGGDIVDWGTRSLWEETP